MSKRDYYDVLGLAKDASDEDIKKEYRKLAMKYHPDRNQGDTQKECEEKFKEAKEAYEILSDPQKRSVYDQFGHTADAGQFAHGKRHPQSWTFDDMGEMQRVMEEVFRTNGGFRDFARSRQQTHPLVVLNISLADAYTGRTVKHDANTTIVIPKGIRSGSKLYINGKFYQIDVRPDAKFKRSLDDLMVEINITAVEAMLGIEASLTHLDGGQFQFSIPAGIQSGQIVKLTKMGMKNPETEMTGDLLVRISISIPRNLTDAEKETLKSLSHRDSLII